MNYLFVILGAAFGSSLRFFLTTVFNQSNFAYGTLIANGLGSFLAGVFFVIISQKINISDDYRLVLIIGFCGSLTTLSAISLDSINLFSAGNHLSASVNLLANIFLSLILLGLGIIFSKFLLLQISA